MQIFKLRAGKAEFAQFHASTDWTIRNKKSGSVSTQQCNGLRASAQKRCLKINCHWKFSMDLKKKKKSKGGKKEKEKW